MSSTNRGAERRADDLYVTPHWVTHRLLDACPWLLPGEWKVNAPTWHEPARGTGAIVEAVNSWCRARPGVKAPSWLTQDIREMPKPAVEEFVCQDFLSPWWPFPHRVPEVLITNPPFSLAEEFVRRALAVCPGYVVMLLRLAFLETEERNQLLREQPPDIYVLPNRPSFTGKGQDSCAYAWMVWPEATRRHREHGEVHILATTPLAERRSAPRPQLEIGGATP